MLVIIFALSLFIFVVVACSDINKPHNGRITYDQGTENKRPVNTIATYECDNGHKLIGDKNRTCENSGEWSGMPLKCIGV